MPTLMGLDSDHRALAGRGRPRGRGHRHARRHGDAVRRHRPRRRSGVDDDQRPGGDHARLLRRGRRGQGPADRLGGTIQTDILKEYIAQKEWCFPVDPDDAPAGRHDRVVHAPRAALAHRSRSPATTSARPARPPRRSWPSRSRTASPTSSRRSPRPRRRRLRAAAELLLQRPQRLLRGDRQVPRRAPDLGARAARHVRRAQPEFLDDALPRADRGRVADRASSR